MVARKPIIIAPLLPSLHYLIQQLYMYTYTVYIQY